jgi:hypothetical protein
MKMTWVLAVGLLAMPQVAAAQLEIGVDTGLGYADTDPDATISFDVPVSGARLGFSAGPQMLIETRLEFDWAKAGDASGTSLFLVPGVNYLLNERVYVRGNIGLSYSRFDNGVVSGSSTQYIFGGALGMRRALGSGAVLRFEAGADKWLESDDGAGDDLLSIHGTVGVSAIIGG